MLSVGVIAMSATIIARMAAPVRVATLKLSWSSAASRSSPILCRQRVIDG